MRILLMLADAYRNKFSKGWVSILRFQPVAFNYTARIGELRHDGGIDIEHDRIEVVPLKGASTMQDCYRLRTDPGLIDFALCKRKPVAPLLPGDQESMRL